MKRRYGRTLLCAGLGLALAAPALAAQKEKAKSEPIELFPAMPTVRPEAQTVLGRSEHVRILDHQWIDVTANLDTKQKHSTLYVADMKYFVHDGDMWVSFVVDNGLVMHGKVLTLQRKVLKDEHVKERGGGLMHRPWVSLDLCVGPHYLPVELALADRSTYTAQLRLGAPDIDKIGRVDESLQFTAAPDCNPPGAPPSPSSTVDEN